MERDVPPTSRSPYCWRRSIRKYGYDFREYSRAHVKRRLRHRLLLSSGLEQHGRDDAPAPGRPGFLSKQCSWIFPSTSRRCSGIPGFTRRSARKSYPCCRTYPFSRSLARRLLQRGGGLLHGHPPQGGGALGQDSALRHGPERGGFEKRPRKASIPSRIFRDWTRNYQKSGGRGVFRETITPPITIRPSSIFR